MHNYCVSVCGEGGGQAGVGVFAWVEVCASFLLVVVFFHNVYVSENGPHCVSVFTPQGDYITTFGGKGSEEGQFQKIYGLIINDKDTIIASDLENGRLQIY